MKCIICHGEEIESKEVEEEIRFNDDLVRVTVRVLVCRSCGERYYDRQTMRFLEEFEQKLQDGEVALQQVGRVLTSR